MGSEGMGMDVYEDTVKGSEGESSQGEEAVRGLVGKANPIIFLFWSFRELVLR